MRSLALLAALAACGGSSPPPAQTANTSPVASSAPAPRAEPAPAAYGGDSYGGDAYGGEAGYDPSGYTPPHRTDADWGAILAKPVPPQYPTCLAYRDAFAKLYQCDKLPPASKDSMYQAYESFITVFDGSLPPEAITALNDGCKAGADALEQTISALGCTP